MRGVILLDEGALHEAILEAERERRPRVWSAARFSEARGNRPTGMRTGLRGASLDEEARVAEKARRLELSRKRGLPAQNRRSGAPRGAAPFGAHLRTTEAPGRRSTPLVLGEGKEGPRAARRSLDPGGGALASRAV
jgi:hypothetical protein